MTSIMAFIDNLGTTLGGGIQRGWRSLTGRGGSSLVAVLAGVVAVLALLSGAIYTATGDVASAALMGLDAGLWAFFIGPMLVRFARQTKVGPDGAAAMPRAMPFMLLLARMWTVLAVVNMVAAAVTLSPSVGTARILVAAVAFWCAIHPLPGSGVSVLAALRHRRVTPAVVPATLRR